MEKQIKINFGSSYNTVEGWINVDNSLRHIIVSKIPYLPRTLFHLGLLTKSMYLAHKKKQFKTVVFGDARKKLKFKENSVDFIYSSHMIEHFYPKEAFNFLKECYRILRPGGILRLAVPDLEKSSKKYLEDIKKNKNSKPAKEFNEIIYASSKKTRFGHHWMFDFLLIKDFLHNVGFKDIRKCGYQTGNCPDLDKIENRKESLFVEAIKEGLDNLEGEVFRKDFDNACKDIYNQYKSFSDKRKKLKEKANEKKT